MDANDPRHGTRRGYYAHRRDDETACVACKRAAASAEARYEMNRARGIPGRLSPVGTQRRLQALVALGFTWSYLDRYMGNRMAEKFGSGRLNYVFPATHAKVLETFNALADTEPPQTTAAERGAVTKARNMARRHGWPPPGAWFDIDDPDERPDPGWRPLQYRAEELAAEWDHLRWAGVSIYTAASQLGVTVGAIEKAVERVGKRAS